MKPKEIIRSILILWSCLMCHNVIAMPSPIAADTTFYRNYSYVRFVVDSLATDSITDEEFLDIAAKVIFPVNKYDLPKQDSVLTELREKVLPQMNRDSLQLIRILFRGAASPEGPYRWNKFLGEHRAQALYDYVKSQMSADSVDSSAVTLIETEDYPLLCVMMKRAGDPDYDFVKTLCDKHLRSHQYGQLKQQLRTARHGRLWRRLLKTYYPQLRAARLVLLVRQLPSLPPVVKDTVVQSEQKTDTIAPTQVVAVQEVTEPEVLPRRELLAVKTNLLWWGAYVPGYDRWCPIPNVAIEYYPLKGHFTFGASFDMPWWQDYDAHKYFQARNYQVEARYYLNGANESYGENGLNGNYKKAYTGFYLQGYAHGGVFGICFDKNRGWVGEGVGAGIGAGYVMPITKTGRWRLEMGVQLGYFRCKYDPYKYENPVNPDYHDNLYYYKWSDKPEYFKKRQYRWNWLGPTRIGITLTYDLLYRKIQSKGVGLKSTERRVEP